MTSTAPSRARLAYDTLEPFHVLAYFNRGLGAATRETGLDQFAFYTGTRGAPLGDCSSAVVAAAFVNFNPDPLRASWDSARAVGLERLSEVRYRMLDEQYHEILGDAADHPYLTEAADRILTAAAGLPTSGRPLGAAWLAAEPPREPAVRLWHALAVAREWRGDNHIAALVVEGINGIDACTFHEAQLPDPTVRRRVLGRDMTLLTRQWSEQQWEDSVDRLVDRGLAERTDTGHRLTAEGAARYDDIEATTDALTEPLWTTTGLDDVVEQLRPYVKTLIDAGVLPGTRRKS
ncbi:hypothetical protein GYA93_06160 [Gordonia desulfuricans]|uniref:Uncharacterized protein n=1 Tax=Gordonia desulfuricans TaxID=89051 RepID=A0A7K3LNN9_9ACTN|nr:hypothetical protein [Gordonia desulfuricans]NDK89167.1 hypothetical protein [Gordonia desulfuricans]